MMVGHTKFAPDWCFGLLKQEFRSTDVGCLTDLERVVNKSATVNHTQLVGREDGTIIVPQYDWAGFLSTYFKRQAFEGIKSLHHLVFEASAPGIVRTRLISDGVEKSIPILNKTNQNWKPDPTILPSQIHPPGVSRERQQYLYEKIREFCPEYARDTVCPNPDSLTTDPSSPTPSTPPPPSPSPSTPPPPSPSSPLSIPPAPKRRRRRKNY